MASLLQEIARDNSHKYKDRRFKGNEEAWVRCLEQSVTVYVGNLAFTTREEQLYEVFGKVGIIDRVIMGLHKQERKPCGFAFVIYFTREAAEAAVSYINRTKVDNRFIRVDIDWGFEEGRQYGRGKMGGQVRDEYRIEHDSGRPAMRAVEDTYGSGMTDPTSYRGKRKRDGSFGGTQAPIPPQPPMPHPPADAPPNPPSDAPPPPPPPPAGMPGPSSTGVDDHAMSNEDHNDPEQVEGDKGEDVSMEGVEEEEMGGVEEEEPEEDQ